MGHCGQMISLNESKSNESRFHLEFNLLSKDRSYYNVSELKTTFFKFRFHLNLFLLGHSFLLTTVRSYDHEPNRVNVSINKFNNKICLRYS